MPRPVVRLVVLSRSPPCRRMNDRKTRPEAKTALRTRNKAFEPPGLRAPARALLIMNARAYYKMPAITSRRSLRLTQETPRREGVANGLQGQSERALKRPEKKAKTGFDNSTTPRITAYSLYNFENTILDKTHNLLTKANSAQKQKPLPPLVLYELCDSCTQSV